MRPTRTLRERPGPARVRPRRRILRQPIDHERQPRSEADRTGRRQESAWPAAGCVAGTLLATCRTRPRSTAGRTCGPARAIPLGARRRGRACRSRWSAAGPTVGGRSRRAAQTRRCSPRCRPHRFRPVPEAGRSTRRRRSGSGWQPTSTCRTRPGRPTRRRRARAGATPRTPAQSARGFGRNVVMPDVVVVGGGAMGSATAWQLARRGADVILLEQFGPGHTRGSSHGSSRIVRLSYADPFYVDLAAAAYEQVGRARGRRR